MSGSRIGGTPIYFASSAPKPAPRFDAADIDRLAAIAADFYPPRATRADERAEPPCTEDIAAMKSYVDFVDGPETIPAKYVDDPVFVAGVFLGAQRRGKNLAYLNRPRKPVNS